MNIFTKDVRPQKLRPVMLYIFGGGYNSGCAWLQAYSPDFLFMADVVVVTFNYRLGAFGFLSFGDKELNVPGNAGLKDQAMAIKFVSENIANFGGDPNNITLFGHSSGAACVAWHCYTDRSKGLFHRAILLSGSILSNVALLPRKDWAFRLATKIGYNGSKEEREIFEFLKTADAEKIVEFQKSLIRDDEPDLMIAFGPCVEPYVTDKTFIWGNSIEMFRSSWSHDIDMIIGGTIDEGLMFYFDFRPKTKAFEDFKLESIIPIENLDAKDPRAVAFLDDLRRIYYSQTAAAERIGLTRNERGYIDVS